MTEAKKYRILSLINKRFANLIHSAANNSSIKIICPGSDCVKSVLRSRQSGSNFSSPKANFEIKTWWTLAQLSALKQVNFASLTDNFIVSFSKFFKLWCWVKHSKHKTAFRAWKVIGTFEKRAMGLKSPRPSTEWTSSEWMWLNVGLVRFIFLVLGKETLAVSFTKGGGGEGEGWVGLVCLECALNLWLENSMFRSASSLRWLNDLTDWTYGLD